MVELVWEKKYDQSHNKTAPISVALPFQTIETINESSQQRCTLRWVSCEPLLAPLPDLHKHGLGSTIMWCFTGGESDRYDPRPKGGVPQDWFRDIRDQCNKAGIPFHFLQQGGSKPCHCGCLSKYGCRRLDGRMWQQYPVPSLIAEGPKRGKRQREHVLDLFRKNNVPAYKTPVQTETTRGIPRQTDRILLTDTISVQTLSNLRNALPDTTLTLETWPQVGAI